MLQPHKVLKLLVLWVVTWLFTSQALAKNKDFTLWAIPLAPSGIFYEGAGEIRGVLEERGVLYLAYLSGEIKVIHAEEENSYRLPSRVLAPLAPHPAGGALALTEDCRLFHLTPEDAPRLLLRGFGYCPYPPAVSSQEIIIANSQGFVASLDPEGGLRWWTRVPGISAPPKLYEGKVFIVAQDRLVVLHESQTWWSASAPGWQIYGPPVANGTTLWVLLRQSGVEPQGLLAQLEIEDEGLVIKNVVLVPYPQSPLGLYEGETPVFVSQNGLETIEKGSLSLPIQGRHFPWPPFEAGKALWLLSREGDLWKIQGEMVSHRTLGEKVLAPPTTSRGWLYVATVRGRLWREALGATPWYTFNTEKTPLLTPFPCGEDLLGLWPLGEKFVLFDLLTGESQAENHGIPGLAETDLDDFTLPYFGLPLCTEEKILFPHAEDPTPLGVGGFGGRVFQLAQGRLSTYWATASVCDPDEPLTCDEKRYRGYLLGTGLSGEKMVLKEAGPFYAPLSVLSGGEEIVLAANRNRLVYAISSAGLEKGRFVMGAAGLLSPEVVELHGQTYLMVASLDGFLHFYDFQLSDSPALQGQPPAFSCDLEAPVTGVLQREGYFLAGNVNGELLLAYRPLLASKCQIVKKVTLKEIPQEELLEDKDPPLYVVRPLTLGEEDGHRVAWVAVSSWYGKDYTLIAKVDLDTGQIVEKAFEAKTKLYGSPVILKDTLFFLVED